MEKGEKTPEKGGSGEGKEEVGSADFVKVEIAPSNRSECRKCKTKIEKGEIRMAVCYDDGVSRNYPWRHLICFYLTKHYIDAKLEPADIRGFKDLNEDQKLKVEDRITKLVSGEIE